MTTPLQVFISYSHNKTDRPLLDQLIHHCAPLLQAGKITFWEDSKILPGGDWEQSIRENLERANIVILLVSSDYLASDYVNRIEVPLAMHRQAAGECAVVPVLLRSCLFELMPYSEYEFLPKTPGDQLLVPLDLWPNRDDAFATIVRRLNVLIKAKTENKPLPPEPEGKPITPPPPALADLDRQGHEQQISLATQKLNRLQTALLLETDAGRQFAYEHDIQKLETLVANLKAKL